MNRTPNLAGIVHTQTKNKLQAKVEHSAASPDSLQEEGRGSLHFEVIPPGTSLHSDRGQ